MPTGVIQDERLLQAIAEDLKTPLLQIARQAELVKNSKMASISSIADMSLRLIDSFLMSMGRLGQQALELEPVSVSSLLYDTAEILQPLAKLHGCELDIGLSGKYGPVMAHQPSLQSAFVLIGYNLIETSAESPHKNRVVLAAHKSAKGLVAGVYDSRPGLSADMFRRGRALYGQARQAMPSAGTGAGAGIFVASSLLQSMAAPLHLATHNKLAGLATTLIPSRQLQLIG